MQTNKQNDYHELQQN